MPFTMIGRLSECVLLAYRTPAESVRRLVGRGMELVTRGDWAFWNIVVCRIDRMRPEGLPRIFGISYNQIAYRLYVRAVAADEQVIGGLYFIRSDADNRLISQFGNLMTDFKFNPADISLKAADDLLELDVRNSPDRIGDARLRLDLKRESGLAPDSCFDSMEEAKEFLKYRPLGLSCDAGAQWLKLAEVIRDEAQWDEKPVGVSVAQWNFFEHIGQKEVHLELATRVAPIDYQWRLGGRIKL